AWCLALAMLGMSPAAAWTLTGYVYCDNNQNGQIDPGVDEIVEHAWLELNGVTAPYFDKRRTDSTGWYWFSLLDTPEEYTVTLLRTNADGAGDPNGMPADAEFVIPASGSYTFDTYSESNPVRNFLISSETCVRRDCWLTGGGVKFDEEANHYMGERGPRHNWGGNVYPSCDPKPGDGGQWTHIAHGDDLRFQGREIEVVRCGNVEGIDPGSTSPETPFNFIEFRGTGILKPIAGNGKKDNGSGGEQAVSFFARAEDRNEPGASDALAGSRIDRYFLHVFDADGNTLLLVDMDGDPNTVDPIEITKGNMQLHASSCDGNP
ncbi:MAG: hypothetical protein JSV80_03080, partial [Acidobacteriota bacterium]